MGFTVQQAVAEKIRHINEFRDTYMADKFLYDNIEWDSDRDARNNINDAYDYVVAQGENADTSPITWRDYNNLDRPIPNAAYLIGMKFAMTEHFRLCHLAARWHKASVIALGVSESNPMAILAYDHSTLWPNVTPV